MHIHDEISRITDMDDISRIDLQGVALADLPVVTREVAFAGVETALGEDLGSRLPGQAVERRIDKAKLASIGKQASKELALQVDGKPSKHNQGAMKEVDEYLKFATGKLLGGSKDPAEQKQIKDFLAAWWQKNA